VTEQHIARDADDERHDKSCTSPLPAARNAAGLIGLGTDLKGSIEVHGKTFFRTQHAFGGRGSAARFFDFIGS
jgi:hypothetical protein